jgi:DNA (cytosine-5)-methyltransferase 1
MATIINTKIGLSKGRKRLFIEGRKLSREGVKPGMMFNLAVKDSQLSVEWSESGKYKVSRRKNRTSGDELPVLDITAAELANLFEEHEQVRVLVQQGKIVVTTHHLTDNTKRREQRSFDKLTSNQALSVCSVFHGNGIMDTALHHGFAHNGVKTKVAVAIERDSRYLESSLRNNPELWDKNSVVIESPLEAVNIQRNKQAVECDLFFAGIPCTGASLSGRSKNKLKQAEDHSEAGSMFFYTLELIAQLNPWGVVLENVPQYASTASMAVIRSVLDSLGYTVQERVFNGVEFGALENRDRLVIVALSKGIDTFDIDSVVKGQLYPKPDSVNDILDDVPLDSPRWKSFTYLAEKEKRDKEAGKGFARQLLSGEESCLGTIGKGYAKCRSTEPFIKHPTDENLSRILTKAEHARVKCIPESMVDGLSDSVAHEALGQSVIYSVFEILGLDLSWNLQQWVSKKNNDQTSNVVQLKKCA